MAARLRKKRQKAKRSKRISSSRPPTEIVAAVSRIHCSIATISRRIYELQHSTAFQLQAFEARLKQFAPNNEELAATREENAHLRGLLREVMANSELPYYLGNDLTDRIGHFLRADSKTEQVETTKLP